MTFINSPSNPAELAEIRAEESTSDGFEISAHDEHLLAELDFAATELGFTGRKYFVEANRALIIPASFNSQDSVTYNSFFGLTFEGVFATYSKVHIGRLVGSHAVRAVCLAFPAATLLPYFDKLNEQDILYVPALSVRTIENTN